MTLVSYVATFTVSFLKCKVGKLILPMVIVKINTASISYQEQNGWSGFLFSGFCFHGRAERLNYIN